MTGSELSVAVAFGVRDTPETTYTPREKFVYLQEGVKVLANELARRKSAQVAQRTVLQVGPEGVAFPEGWLGFISARVVGGAAPLPLMSRHDFPLSGGHYLGCFIEASKLHLYPEPETSEDLDLIYAAMPALGRAAIPADDDSARAALAVELPFAGLFDLVLVEFVKMRCLNRNEYDTKMELGLYRLLQSQAADVAAMDSVVPEAHGDRANYDFSGGW
ncbi:MAG: hypothetical protein KQH53_08320 [Desulfarculaceae bacterium]|nr:hypothetical protein [Desulfarculaceae bacterium]